MLLDGTQPVFDFHAIQRFQWQVKKQLHAMANLAQGKRKGRALLLVRANGRRRIVLHTGGWMLAAKHIYESLGLERERGIDFSPAPGIDLIGYALDLS